MSYESTLEYIHSVQWRGQKPGLGRTRELLACLGNPEQELKYVHIAGTNGKGSTAAMISSVLCQAGFRTGLFTSPYINYFRERIQINGEMISPEELEEVVDALRPFADGMEDLPSEFELITAAAFLYFRKKRCDIVVLEVGLGGEFDATNVISSPEVCVFTSIGLDHTGVLGTCVEEIAKTKAGIIKSGCEVVSYGEDPRTEAVLREACDCKGCLLHIVDFGSLKLQKQDVLGSVFDFDTFQGLQIPLVGTYQPKNAALAVTALQVLSRRGWDIPETALRQGLSQVVWPGRFEILCREPLFLLDGSHNPPGMAATAESLHTLFPSDSFVFLLSVMEDKDVDGMLRLLLPLARRFVTVTADTPRAMPGKVLAERIRLLGGQADDAPSIPCAVALARELAGNGPVCALGTLYFSGDVRRAVQSLI